MKLHKDYLKAIKVDWSDLIDLGNTFTEDDYATVSQEEYLLIKLIHKIDLLYFKGNLDLIGSNIAILPDNFKTRGSLDLYNSDITSLPKNLTVGWNLYLKKTGVTILPDDLNVTGLIFVKRDQLKEVPEHLKDKINISNHDRWMHDIL